MSSSVQWVHRPERNAREPLLSGHRSLAGVGGGSYRGSESASPARPWLLGEGAEAAQIPRLPPRSTPSCSQEPSGIGGRPEAGQWDAGGTRRERAGSPEREHVEEAPSESLLGGPRSQTWREGADVSGGLTVCQALGTPSSLQGWLPHFARSTRRPFFLALEPGWYGLQCQLTTSWLCDLGQLSLPL